MNERISALDGWRAISVALVIFAHLLADSSIGSHDVLVVTISNGYGALGVRMFFVISGFVICRGFIQEQSTNRRVSMLAFYVRRIFRIVPPLVLYLSMICILALTRVVNDHATGALEGLLFICNFHGIDCGGYLGQHQWSLAVEEQFYLVFPLLFVFLAPRPKYFLAILVAIPSISLMLAVLKFANAAAFIGTFVFIGVGVVSAFYERQITGLAAKVGPVFIASAILAVMLFSIMPAGRLNTILLSVVLPVLIAFVLLATTLVQSTWQRYLSARPIVIFGRISYGVYLWQQLATYPFAGAGYLFYFCSISACVIFCLGSFYYLERPLIAFGRELSTRLQGAQVLSGRRDGCA